MRITPWANFHYNKECGLMSVKFWVVTGGLSWNNKTSASTELLYLEQSDKLLWFLTSFVRCFVRCFFLGVIYQHNCPGIEYEITVYCWRLGATLCIVNAMSWRKILNWKIRKENNLWWSWLLLSRIFIFYLFILYLFIFYLYPLFILQREIKFRHCLQGN